MPDLGPQHWDQPLFGGDGVPQLVVNGHAVEFPLESFTAALVDEQGVVVQTAGAQHVPHQLLESAAAPLSLGVWEIEVEIVMISEEIRRLIHEIAARARAHTLRVWIDRSGFDFWEGDGARTTFVLSRSTGYGSTGVSWGDRPARCWVDGVELDMVEGAPASGECQLSQSDDSTSIVLGAAPAAGEVVTLAYYPVLRATAEVDESREDNGGTIALTLREYIPRRSYG
jgi:uncharacterized small protein (DUF1192 family)